MTAAVQNVYLLGTGVIENGWAPVRRALAKVEGRGRAAGDFEDLESWTFALDVGLAHLTHAWAGCSDDELQARFGDGDHSAARKLFGPTAEATRKTLRQLREEIAGEIENAQRQGELSLKESSARDLAAALGHGRTILVTANWDLAIEKWLEQHGGIPDRVLHVHGSIDCPDHLLLPGERPEEPHRLPEENAAISRAYWRAISAIGAAENVCIAGLSLSPLDAALGIVIGMGLRRNGAAAGKLVILSRDEDAARIERQLRPFVPQGWSIERKAVAEE